MAVSIMNLVIHIIINILNIPVVAEPKFKNPFQTRDAVVSIILFKESLSKRLYIESESE